MMKLSSHSKITGFLVLPPKTKCCYVLNRNNKFIPNGDFNWEQELELLISISSIDIQQSFWSKTKISTQVFHFFHPEKNTRSFIRN